MPERRAAAARMPVRLFRSFILRRFRQERLRSLLTVAGIALGVAVVVAVRLANASSVGGFAAALDVMSGAASLEIVAPATGVDEARLPALGWLRDFGDVSPVIEADVLAGPAGRAEPMRVLGVDILRDRAFREYRLIEFADGERQPAPQEFLALLVAPDSVITTDVFARRHGLRVGDPLEVAIGDERQTFRVRGLLRNEGPARVLDGNFLLMDIAAAQWAFGRLGRLDRLELRLAEGLDVAAAERQIAERLPAGLSVQRPARRGEQVETMLRAFHFNLTALAYVALLVGLFLVYNTVSVSVIARREEIGTLRAVGASRRLVLGLFLGEAAGLAIAGSVAGVGLGWVLAHAAVQLTSATVNALHGAAAAPVPALRASDVALGLGSGVALSLAAAAAPALEASRVGPLAALRGADRVEARYRARPLHLALGVGLLVAAAALAQLGPVDGLPLFGFAAALATVFGIAYLVPAALVVLSRVGGRPLARLFGVEGLLAHANLAASIPRLSVSVAALAVALAMMVAIAIMIGSFRETVIYWVGQTLQADLYMATARRSSLDSQAVISEELERAVAAHPAVAAVDRFRSANLVHEGRLTVLGAGDFDVLLAHGNLLFKAPRDGRAAVRAAIGTDAIVVSEAFALKTGAEAGSLVHLHTPHGRAPFRVAAVYYDYTSDRGVIVMDRATFTRHYGDMRPTSLTVYLHEGSDPAGVRDALMQALGERHRVFIHTNASLRTEVLRIFDSTFAITYALEAIAIFVGIMGVTGTLLTLILERRRELTTLRLVGADARQIRRTVVIEAGLIGLVSQALGLVAGLGLALILIFVINVQSFGWTIQFHVPALFLLQASFALFVTMALAGIYPARIAAAAPPVPQAEA
jgi:putative ABC transport system permease protein